MSKNIMRRTKIIVTIGPASSNEKVIKEFLELRVDVFRINFSHGTISEHLSQIAAIRRLSKEVGFEPAILLDLPGPKIRVGKILSGFLELKTGDTVYLQEAETASGGVIPVNIKNLANILKPQIRILLVDGKIELRAKNVSNKEISAEVIRGGILHSHQGINLPDSILPFPSLTERDKEGIEMAFKEDVDWLALSFVRLETDLIELKDIVATRGEHMGVIAKVERPEAVRNIDKIIDAADAVMVARGDLGVEMGVEEVPILQKKIISICSSRGKPSITATQMLESMLENPYPTRAEVSDIANAIYDGTDCVMLSEETAAGKYPLEAVKVMLEVISKTEAAIDFGNSNRPAQQVPLEEYDAIGHAASNLASDLGAKAIVCCTFTGFTAQMLSKYRPRVGIYAFTISDFIRNKMNLLWGVYPGIINYTDSVDKLIFDTSEVLKKKYLFKKGERIVFIAGLPLRKSSETNFIKIHVIQ